MSDENEGGSGRITGTSLRTAAALLENPVTRPLLTPSAFKRLKLPLLREQRIPEDVGVYTHRHFGSPPAPGDGEVGS